MAVVVVIGLSIFNLLFVVVVAYVVIRKSAAAGSNHRPLSSFYSPPKYFFRIITPKELLAAFQVSHGRRRWSRRRLRCLLFSFFIFSNKSTPEVITKWPFHVEESFLLNFLPTPDIPQSARTLQIFMDEYIYVKLTLI